MNVAPLSDLAVCRDCVADVFKATNRRHRYPFTTCAKCGPRASILHTPPFARALTSMRGFRMCPECQREYDDPDDRRYRSEANACPVCGPHVTLWDAHGRAVGERDHAIRILAKTLRQGLVAAVKSLGGFHLMVDASSDWGVHELRRRAHRGELPFALMYENLRAVERDCVVSAEEARLLTSPAAPIVLLHRKPHSTTLMSPAVAPGSPELGAVLPSTPLQHLLLADLGGPLVVASGNLAEAPSCTRDEEALDRLMGVADVFLVHNQPIVHRLEDSIVRWHHGHEVVVSRGRGYSAQGPLPEPKPAFAAVTVERSKS